MKSKRVNEHCVQDDAGRFVFYVDASNEIFDLEARIAELEGALLEDAKRIEAEADIVEEAFIDLDTAKARIAELEGAMRHMIDAVSAENVHRHEWEIDEDVTRALEQAGQALEVSDDG